VIKKKGYWNSGMFFLRKDSIIYNFKKYCPTIYKHCVNAVLKAKLKNHTYYLNKTSKIYRINSQKFLEDFNILSVQRSLKIIGIFSRLFKRDKKKQYLKLIPYTWKLLEIRSKDKMFGEINIILNKFIPSKTRAKNKFYAN